jgi:hypothetical protein
MAAANSLQRQHGADVVVGERNWRARISPKAPIAAEIMKESPTTAEVLIPTSRLRGD